jgi:hypothetical protein
MYKLEQRDEYHDKIFKIYQIRTTNEWTDTKIYCILNLPTMTKTAFELLTQPLSS